MTIPQEAIEAAAQSIYETSWYGDVPLRWGEMAEDSKIFYRQRAAACLAEALPAIEKEIRAQVGQEIYDKLPVKLGETAASEYGWLSDLQYVSPKTSADFEMVELSYVGGSIDISHIAEHAAQIAEGANHA